MTEPEDKWVWADEEADPFLPKVPLIQESLTPIVEWTDEKAASANVVPNGGNGVAAPSVEERVEEPPAKDAPIEAAPAKPEPPIATESKAPPILQPTGDPGPADEVQPKVASPARPSSHGAVISSFWPRAKDRKEVKEPAADKEKDAGKKTSPAMVKATVLHLEGHPEEAIAELRCGLKAGEPAIDLYAAMGNLQMELERFEDAAESYREVLKRRPDHNGAQENLAVCQQRIEEHEKAARPKISPSLLRATMLHLENNLEAAVAELRKGLKDGEPGVDLYAALGHLQFELGRFDEAAESYRQVVAGEPGLGACHYNLAVCLGKLGKREEALASFEEAYRIHPERIEIALGVGISLLYVGRYTDAAAAFDRCLDGNAGDTLAIFGKAYALHRLGKLDEAEAAYQEVLKLDPKQEQVLENLVLLSRARKNEAAAIDFAKRLLALEPDACVALEALVARDVAAEDYQSARTHLARITQNMPDSYAAWFNLGLACQATRRFKEAADAFGRAAGLTPGADPLLGLGASRLEENDADGARAAFERALQIAPDLPAALRSLMVLAERRGDYEEAEKLCARLLAREPRSKDTLFRLGFFRLQRGDYRAAAEDFGACLKLQADWTAAKLNLGIAQWKLGQRDEARKNLESVMVAQPESVEALHCLAAMAVERGDLNRSLELYTKLIDLGEHCPEVLYNTGLLLHQSGKLEDAARMYRRALDEKPGLTEALVSLGQALQGLGKLEEARSYLRQALESSAGPA